MSEGGILAIKGVKSQYYISMNKAGQLQGKVIPFPFLSGFIQGFSADKQNFTSLLTHLKQLRPAQYD